MRTYNLLLSIFLCLFLVQINTVKAEELYGIFMVVKGTVDIDSVKTGKNQAKVGVKVYPGDKVTTQKDSRAKIVMSDRNVMNISPESVLTILKYDNDPKSNVKNVELELSQGKVRNNVEQKYDGDKSKFIIKTPTAVAGVRGTQFLTSFDVKSRVTEVVTFKGAVQMAPVLASGKVSAQFVTIKKGEASSVKQGQEAPETPRTVPKEEMKKVEKESQAKQNQPAENSVAEGNDPAGAKPEKSDKDAKKDADNGQEKSVASNENKREPSSETKPTEQTMIDKKDMDLGAAKDVKPPILVEAPPLPPVVPRLPSMVQPQLQNPVIDEIIRVKLNKTTVIIKPVLPQ